MIYLTESANDRGLLPLFPPDMAMLAPIPYGDFNFFGVWRAGEPVTICGERKRLRDLINCIHNGRYLAQVQKARAAGFSFLFLIVEIDEHRYRIGDDGLMQVRKGKEWEDLRPEILYWRIDDYLNQVHHILGVQVKRSGGPQETVRQVTGLYRMFQKPPEEHGSLKTFWTIPEPVVDLWERPSLVRRVAKELPGIGWELSRRIEEKFPTVDHLIRNIDLVEEVEGVGKKKADEILRAISRKG